MLTSLFNVIAIVFFVNRLARAVLSPKLPNWRLIPIESRAARRLFWLVRRRRLSSALDFFLTASTRRWDRRCR